MSAPAAEAGFLKYSELVVADRETKAPPANDAIRITYLGVNGYLLENRNHALLVDPYFTRISLGTVILNRPIKSNAERVQQALAQMRRPQDILVTHAHFDHLLDVPTIIRETHARLFAGPTAVNLVESFGIQPNLCQPVVAGRAVSVGPWKVRIFDATHDRLIGKSPPFPGRINTSSRQPRKPSDWRLGEPLAFVIEGGGKRIYIDSGGVPGHPPDPQIGKVDLAILGVALPDSRRRFAEAVLTLQPRYILPSHQDDFFAPLSHGFQFGRLTSFPQLLRMHAQEHLPGRIVLLDYFRPWTLH